MKTPPTPLIKHYRVAQEHPPALNLDDNRSHTEPTEEDEASQDDVLSQLTGVEGEEE